MVNSMSAIRLARLAAGLATHEIDFAIMMTSHCVVFGGLLSRPPIFQNKFPAKISGYDVKIAANLIRLSSFTNQSNATETTTPLMFI